ncbi:MAG TPA: SusC/RagA family TonB-linked outer membrane protein [Gemmatimonadales bacterium]|nr:SusC/RagA family TonB-linked outer membrane protein [Gemmatimonadales bacterium]
MRPFTNVRRLLAGLTGMLLFVAAPLAAQAGSITGKVTDKATSQPIQGARLQLSQTGQVVIVRPDGRYSFTDVTPGNYDVRVIAVGYAAEKKAVVVTAGQAATLDFPLDIVAFTLEEIVTTATGEQRKLELGHTVSTVKADSLTQTEAVHSMADLLQARSAGVTVLPSSGTVGAGTRIRIRGANSVSLSNEPIIVVDGIKVNTDASSSTLGTGGQSPSRLNDINPDEIESIEIVKGPSAATLYGTQAANGVIRITTKHGTAGKPRWNIYGEGGTIQDKNDYLDNYRLVGRTITAGVPGGALRTCLLTQVAAGVCTGETLLTSNPLKDKKMTPISTGYRSQWGANVTGGNDAVQYFVSGEYEDEAGTFKLPDSERDRLFTARGITELPKSTMRPNTNRRVSLRTNLSTHLRDNLDVQTNVGYVTSNIRLPQNDNNVLGMLPSGYFGSTDTLGVAGWGFFAPGEIFSLVRSQSIERFTGSANMQWRPLTWLSNRTTIGYDIAQRNENQFDPTALGPAFGTTPLGNKFDTRTQLKTYTVSSNFTENHRLTSAISGRTTVGAEFARDVFFQNQAGGQRLTFGSQDVDGAAILTASQTTTTIVKLGGFVEEQATFKDRLFLTGALRIDDNSSFGRDFKAIAFPKASLSYLVSDEPGFPFRSFMSLLRLRVAYGASGLQPGALDAITYLSPTASSVAGASTSAATFGSAGLADLKPEKSKEVETGVDASFFQDRVNVEFTYFNKKTSDALIARVLAPSLGISTTRFENLGSVKNSGFELTVNTRVINTPDVAWDLTFAGSTIKNKLVKLGNDSRGNPLPPVISGIQRHTPGYPLGGWWERPLKSFNDANNNGIIELSEIVVGDTAEFDGSPTPTREFSLSQTLSLFRGALRLQGLLDYKGGYKQYNLTEVFRCTATGNNCRGIMDKNAPLDIQARAVARRLQGFASNWGFLENGEFLKLREVSATYNLPGKWAGMVGAQHASVSLAGRNLATWTGYTGVDPEVNGAGQVAFNGFGVQDFLTQPQVRTFILRANLTF